MKTPTFETRFKSSNYIMLTSGEKQEKKSLLGDRSQTDDRGSVLDGRGDRKLKSDLHQSEVVTSP
jgi:hypothetical protein